MVSLVKIAQVYVTTRVWAATMWMVCVTEDVIRAGRETTVKMVGYLTDHGSFLLRKKNKSLLFH